MNHLQPIKESWNREEVATLIRRAFAGVRGKYTIQEPLQINDWIKENVK